MDDWPVVQPVHTGGCVWWVSPGVFVIECSVDGGVGFTMVVRVPEDWHRGWDGDVDCVTLSGCAPADCVRDLHIHVWNSGRHAEGGGLPGWSGTDLDTVAVVLVGARNTGFDIGDVDKQCRVDGVLGRFVAARDPKHE
ncbi:MAG: hypothetical protein FWF25_04445 [Propionibacteriaceae bacterium]|nr:hypothetical protein [Propionibacteriaceae bacterium]